MNENTETRMTADWDPVASVKRKGCHDRSLSRKLITRGIKTIHIPGLTERIAELLRKGIEVRLVDDDNNDAIRIFPLLATDCKTIYPQASTMGLFRDCLADKKAKIFHRGREIDEVELRMQKNIMAERYDEHRKLCVTPDTMVTCPNCGTYFRVGNSKE